MKFTIDRSKWRTGGDSKKGTGIGLTQLENEFGFMCCLGQITKQIFPELDIKLRETPIDVIKQDSCLTEKYNEDCINNNLSEVAMEINDRSISNIARREEELYKLFRQHGHELTFINSYPTEEDIEGIRQQTIEKRYQGLKKWYHV